MKPGLFPFLLGLIWCLTLTLHLQSQDQRHYTCYKTDDQIIPDGRLNEPDWAWAEWSADFIDITGDPSLKPSFRTRIKMLWDNRFIYLAAELEEPDIWGTLQKRDEVIFQDNDFEVFLDPDRSGLNYCEIEVNALGTIWDLMLTKAYKDQGKPINSWDLQDLRTGIHIHGSLNDPSDQDTAWIVEMALPIAELMTGRRAEGQPADGIQWRMNFSRVEWQTTVSGSTYQKKTDSMTGKKLPEMNWVWSPMGEINMHIPERWGWLEFSEEHIRSDSSALNEEINVNEFKIWVWMNGHREWSASQWDSVMTDLNSKGVTGVLIQADLATLRMMIPIAHKHGIAVEKWLIAMMNNDTALIRRHPDWFVISREGKSSITDPAYVPYYRFLCPSTPEVRQFLKSRIDEHLDIPGLDGIHLDYIRYPDVILPQALWPTYKIIQDQEYAPYDYCYCPVCREKFRSKYGIDPISMESPETNADWRQFRMDQITSLVNEVADHCHGRGAKLSAAVFPGPSVAKQLVRQEWNKWKLDEAMPMLYQNFYYGSLDWIRQQTGEGVTALETRIPLYSGLYIPSLNPRELLTAISKSIAGGAKGISIFNYESMTDRHWNNIEDMVSKSY